MKAPLSPLLFAVLAGLATPAFAQDVPPPAQLPDGAPPAAAPRSIAADDEGAGKSEPWKVDHARGHLEDMRTALSEVLRRLEEARSAKDVIKLNCVNEKLTQVKGLLKISENSEIALEEGVARKEPDATGSEFRKISTAKQRIDQLRTEAEECVGETAVSEQQGAKVEVEEPQDLPSGNLTPILQPTPIPSVRAPAASPK